MPQMSGSVWAEQDTTPAKIEAGLRELLKERHARSDAYVPARVLNLIVVADREWRGEIQNRLDQVGRYHASRTILCSVESRQTTIDAFATAEGERASSPNDVSVLHEQVVLDLGTKHLEHLDTIVDPLVVTDLPRWCGRPMDIPRRFDALLEMAQIVLIDSVNEPDPAAAVRRAQKSTPRAAYERAAEVGSDWSRATVWFGDERCVPPDHEHSNYAMAKEALLDRIDSQPRVRRMEGELGPGPGAAAYEALLREDFGEGLPELDLVLLGLGPDAHTASLFPGDAALDESERLVVGVETPGMAPLVSRVTLTLPVLNAAREVLFLVKGEDKAEAARKAFAGAPDPGAPASLVRPRSCTVLLDPPAAALLGDRYLKQERKIRPLGRLAHPAARG